jgi:hypothetical protein
MEFFVDDVLVEIFLLLEPKDILKIMQASKKFLFLTETQSFWESFASIWIKKFSSSEQMKELEKIKNSKHKMKFLLENREIEFKNPLKNIHRDFHEYSCVIHKIGFYKNEKKFKIFFNAKDENSHDDLQFPHCFNFSFKKEVVHFQNNHECQPVFNDPSVVNFEYSVNSKNEKKGCYIYPLEGLTKSEFSFQYGIPFFGGYLNIPFFELNDAFISNNYLKFILPHLRTKIEPTLQLELNWFSEVAKSLE